MSVHTVTVTKLDNMHVEGLADEEYVDGVEFVIDHCPGGDCTVWWTCAECGKSGHQPTELEVQEGEYTAHGEVHQQIDGEWMVESKSCAARATDSGADGMQEVAQAAGLGTHQIDVSYWGDGCWEVSLVKLTDSDR